MPQKYLGVFRIVMLVIVILLVINTCQFGYKLGMTYVRHGEINFNLKELESKFKEIPAVETDYKIAAQAGDWQKIKENNFFAAGNLPTNSGPTKPGEEEKNPPGDEENIPSGSEETEKKEDKVPFILVAVSIYSSQEGNMAILKDRVTRASYIVEIGEEVNGYKVKAIKREEVILEGKDREVTLSLSKSKGEVR